MYLCSFIQSLFIHKQMRILVNYNILQKYYKILKMVNKNEYLENTAESLPTPQSKIFKPQTKTEVRGKTARRNSNFQLKQHLIWSRICFFPCKICHKFATPSISRLMTFSVHKCVAQILLFEIASFLVTLKTENLSHGSRIILGHTLYFLLLEN